VTTPPKLRLHGEAIYPTEAAAERLEATVGLTLLIDETGKVLSARVTGPAGHGFDEAAAAVAREFVFEPAMRDGVAIGSTVELAYEFHLPKPSPIAAPVGPAIPVAAAVQTGANQSTTIVAKGPADQALEHISASDSQTGKVELSLVPRLRAEGMLEVVPGLFSVQHAGGGKAQQYFLRGFDADHGTDIAFSVDGTPVNAVSHGHGQGFSDLHFLIPETVESVDATKGPYSARVGDFATAGSVAIHMADHADESYARLEDGSTGHQRVVAVESPDLGKDWRMMVAAEAFHEDGPFIHPDNFDRLNGYMKATRKLDEHSEVSVMLMGYGGSWSMSGVLPARAVCGEGDETPVPSAYAGTHCISRWDSIDPSQGGQVQRVELLTSYRRWMGPLELEATVFVLHSNFQLFPNDGIAASFQPEGVRYGSQIEQDDVRTESGANIRLTHKDKLAGMDVSTTFGLQLRDDAVETALHRTEMRQRLDGYPGIPGPITQSQIGETELAAYAEADWRPARWLRFVTGARIDRVDAAVSNENPTAIEKISGYSGAQLASPKATVVVTPIKELDLFANYGRGFHSNDIRTVAEGSATTLLSPATGYEVGTTIRPLKGLTLSAVAFLIDIASELTIDGDTASTTPTGPVRRYGGEFTGRYEFREHFFLNAALTVTHARYTDAADIAAGMDYVPLAPIRTFAAGIGTRQPVGNFTLIGSLFTRSMSDRPATQNWNSSETQGLTATGFTMFDGELGLRWKNIEVLGELLNIGDVAWREGQFAVDSRLPNEGTGLAANPYRPVSKSNPINTAPPTGISFTPGIPRTVMGHATVYW